MIISYDDTPPTQDGTQVAARQGGDDWPCRVFVHYYYKLVY